jgi:hypothetical protein
MRRERIVALVATAVAVVGFGLIAPGAATAASPSEICADLADGQLNGTYSQQDLAAYLSALQNDPTIQGYCSPLVIVTQCTEVAPNTPGAMQAPNGKWYTNAPNGNAAACGPPPAQCTEVPAGTSGAVQAWNGKWYANAPNGNASACTTPPPCTQVAAGTSGAVQATNGIWYLNAPGGNADACTGVAGTTTTTTPALVVPPAPTTTTGVLGSTKTKTAPTPAPRSAAPLATTKTVRNGTLPFTGAQLIVFAIVGGALLAAGLLLHTAARRPQDR